MSAVEPLLTFAEVSVAFAGFASLVSILGRGTSLDDPSVLGVRMRAMLLTSLLVVGFSLFPVILSFYGVGSDADWIASSVALLLTTWWYSTWLGRAIRDLARAGLTASRFQRRVILPTFVLTLVAVHFLLIGNAFLAMPAVYMTALALLLFQSGFAFSLIVISFLPRVDANRD